jgi:hypothetical protein
MFGCAKFARTRGLTLPPPRLESNRLIGFSEKTNSMIIALSGRRIDKEGTTPRAFHSPTSNPCGGDFASFFRKKA